MRRFPHPSTYASLSRLSLRKASLLMLRIEQDWYPTLEIAEKGTEVEREEALKQLKEELLGIGYLPTNSLFYERRVWLG